MIMLLINHRSRFPRCLCADIFEGPDGNFARGR